MVNVYGSRLLKKFNVGDLVSWKHVNEDERKFGLILGFRNVDIENGKRSCVIVELSDTTGKIVNLMIGSLKLESKCSELGKT